MAYAGAALALRCDDAAATATERAGRVLSELLPLTHHFDTRTSQIKPAIVWAKSTQHVKRQVFADVSE